MQNPTIVVGTSGWHYKHWKEKFYPKGLSEGRQFSFLTSVFNTVEINNSFYRLPTETAFEQWRVNSPEYFRFAVKASRFITHMKKLKMNREDLGLFFSHVSRLEEKLAVIIFQLPPRWHLNIERLRLFLEALPPGYRYAFEFRHESWWVGEVYTLLEKFGCAFCIYELARQITPLKITANFTYVRLHGPGDKYAGSYTDSILNVWARRFRRWQRNGIDVYCYFDNDQEAFAVNNALTLIKKLSATSPSIVTPSQA